MIYSIPLFEHLLFLQFLFFLCRKFIFLKIQVHILSLPILSLVCEPSVQTLHLIFLAPFQFILHHGPCQHHQLLLLWYSFNGALELTAGKMGTHLASHGIAIQKTALYAHPQAGKIEHYVRTIEEGGQTLLADSGLSMTFWCDAVLTSQYLRNRLPTSMLAANITPFKVITCTKPDVSHLRVWGCQCFMAIPDKLRDKAGFKRFEGIFMGYEEHRLGWRVQDLKGKYHFSHNVTFNEDLSGHLGLPHSLPLPVLPSSNSSGSLPIPYPTHDHVRTAAGRAYDDILKLKDLRRVECDDRRKLASAGGSIVAATANGDVDNVDGLMEAVDGVSVLMGVRISLLRHLRIFLPLRRLSMVFCLSKRLLVSPMPLTLERIPLR